MRWNPTVPDTGGDLEIALLPTNGDTGNGFVWYVEDDCLGADFVKVPRQPQHGADGAIDPADTGAAFGAPIIGAEDRLRIKITPGGSAVRGRLWIWTGW